MYIGNIVTQTKFKEENFNVVDNLNDIKKELPTLIIGWSNTKSTIKDVSILHKKIEDNMWWTFDEKERRVDYEVDIEEFKEKCYGLIGENLNYVYIDILYFPKHKIKKIIKKIKSFNSPIYYISKNNMLYIYDENIVFGLDLNVTKLIGINNIKLLKKISDLPKSTLIKNEIFNKCSSIIKKIKNNNKILPYIYRYGECNENSYSSIVCGKR